MPDNLNFNFAKPRCYESSTSDNCKNKCCHHTFITFRYSFIPATTRTAARCFLIRESCSITNAICLLLLLSLLRNKKHFPAVKRYKFNLSDRKHLERHCLFFPLRPIERNPRFMQGYTFHLNASRARVPEV